MNLDKWKSTIESITKPRILSDNEIAEIIRNDTLIHMGKSTSSLKRPYEDISSSNTQVAPVNKTFLRNIIRNTESHNRREEIADCWREHDMQQRSREVAKSNCSYSPRVVPSTSSSHNPQQEHDRAYWSARKASKTAGLSDNVDDSDSHSDSSSVSSVKVKKSKKEKKSKHKNEKKSKDKKNDKKLHKRKDKGKS